MTQVKTMSDRISGEMQRLDNLAESGKSLANDAKSFAKNTVSTAKDKLGDVVDAGRDVADDAASRTKEVVGAARGKLDAAREAVTGAASHAADTAGRVSRQAGERVMKGADVVADLVRERPFVALGVAFAAGVATLALATRPWRSPSSRLSDSFLDFLETNVSDRARRLAKSIPSLH